MSIFADVCAWGISNPANHGAVCPNDPIHALGGHDDTGHVIATVLLCHEHFLEACAKGYANDTVVDPEEFRRRGGTLR